MTSWTKELDEAAVLATRSGYWHMVLFYLLCGLAAIPTSFLVFSQVFINAAPEHWCAPPPELDSLHISDDVVKSLILPVKNGAYETCRSYDVNPRVLLSELMEYVTERNEEIRDKGMLKTVKTLQLVPVENEEERKIQVAKVVRIVTEKRSKEPTSCEYGWRFNTELYKTTLVTDFNLVCDKDSLPRISNTLFWVGSVFGNLFFGWMSDRYGRRPTILVMIFLEVPLAIAASFPGNYGTYTALRVAGGLFFPALYQLPFILAMELMPPSKRTHAGIVVSTLFASGMCLLSLLAFTLRDWFHLSLATTLPFILLYGYYWIIPESPRWLVGRGRIAEAEKVLRNIAKKNGIELQRGFLIELHKRIKHEEEMAAELIPMNVNGHVSTKDEYIDRRISNMLTFNPDLSKISETDDHNKTDSLERIIALEVADIVNKKSIKSKRDGNDEKDDENEDSLQKATQTDPHTRSPANTLRRKSIQLVNKIFIGDDEDEDFIENKKMDDQNSEGDCKASPLDVFRYPNIRKKFILLTIDWIALGIVYNGMSYNTPNLGVDDYLAFFIGGAVELPAYFIAWQCMERFGRRWVLCVFMSVGGIACLSCALVPEAWPWITVALAMLGRLCAASSFAVFYVLNGELLPTVLRAQAIGASSFIAGLGLLACPYIVHLATYARPLPLIIMGVLSIIAAVTSLFLPETLNQPLPQTLGDGEMFGRNFKMFSFVTRSRHHRRHR